MSKPQAIKQRKWNPVLVVIITGLMLAAFVGSSLLFLSQPLFSALSSALTAEMQQPEVEFVPTAVLTTTKTITVDGYTLSLYPGSTEQVAPLTWQVEDRTMLDVVRWFERNLANRFLLDDVVESESHIVLNGIDVNEPSRGIVIDLTATGSTVSYIIKTLGLEPSEPAVNLAVPQSDSEFVLGASVEPSEVYLGTLTRITYTVIYSGVGNVDLRVIIPAWVMIDILTLPDGYIYDEESRELRWSAYLAGPEKTHFQGLVSGFLLGQVDVPREVAANVVAWPQDLEPVITPAIFRLRVYQFRQ